MLKSERKLKNTCRTRRVNLFCRKTKIFCWHKRWRSYYFISYNLFWLKPCDNLWLAS